MPLDGAGVGPRKPSSSPSTIRCKRTSTSLENTLTRTCMMCWRTCRRCVARLAIVRGVPFAVVVVFVVVVLGGYVLAQEVSPATLLNVPRDSWPTYHGDYTGQRHSRLTQITPA